MNEGTPARQLKRLDVTLDVWKWQGCVIVGGTSSEFAAWAKKYIGVEITAEDGQAGRAYMEKNQPWLLWVESLQNVPTLAHEALHIAAGVLEVRGLRYNEGSEEAYTYTMEFILRSVLNAKARDWKKA